MPTNESDRILAAGVQLTLAGGRLVHLRYSMRSLKMFEDTFGSVSEVHHLLNGLIPDTPEGDPSNVKVVSTLVPILAAGLRHEGITEDDLYDGLAEWDQRTAYFDAIMDALDQAFPTPSTSPGKGSEQASSSPGESSTTQPPASAEATSSSGV